MSNSNDVGPLKKWSTNPHLGHPANAIRLMNKLKGKTPPKTGTEGANKKEQFKCERKMLGHLQGAGRIQRGWGGEIRQGGQLKIMPFK